MYKINKRPTRKRKDCQKASEKRAGQSRKLEGNNIAQRLTVSTFLPYFPALFHKGAFVDTT